MKLLLFISSVSYLTTRFNLYFLSIRVCSFFKGYKNVNDYRAGALVNMRRRLYLPIDSPERLSHILYPEYV